jgi:hypothetical protein
MATATIISSFGRTVPLPKLSSLAGYLSKTESKHGRIYSRSTALTQTYVSYAVLRLKAQLILLLVAPLRLVSGTGLVCKLKKKMLLLFGAFYRRPPSLLHTTMPFFYFVVGVSGSTGMMLCSVPCLLATLASSRGVAKMPSFGHVGCPHQIDMLPMLGLCCSPPHPLLISHKRHVTNCSCMFLL